MPFAAISEVQAVFANRLRPGGDDFLDDYTPGNAIEMTEELDVELIATRSEGRAFCLELMNYLIEHEAPVRNGFVIKAVWIETSIEIEPDDEMTTVHLFLECHSS